MSFFLNALDMEYAKENKEKEEARNDKYIADRADALKKRSALIWSLYREVEDMF